MMRAEVDVYNGSPAEFRAAQTKAAAGPGVASPFPIDRFAGVGRRGMRPSVAPGGGPATRSSRTGGRTAGLTRLSRG